MSKDCPNGCKDNMECVKCQPVIYNWVGDEE